MERTTRFLLSLSLLAVAACDGAGDGEAPILDAPTGGKSDAIETPEFETPARRVTRVNVTSNSGALMATVLDSSPSAETQLLLYVMPEGSRCADEIGSQGQTLLTPVAESEEVVDPSLSFDGGEGPIDYCVVIDNQNHIPISMSLAIDTDRPEEPEEPEEPECEEVEAATCDLPEHTPCDAEDDSLAAVLGLCDAETVAIAEFEGNESAMLVTGGIGTSGTYEVREGERMVILSTGRASELLDPFANVSHSFGDFDDVLPEPVMFQKVSEDGVTCADDPSLIGTGDCSNTIADQFEQLGDANDAATVRLLAEVPENASSLEFDFAMFSSEYPVYYQSQFNDMFVAWIESESWTGNVAFDESGNPMSLNAGFWDFKDAANEHDCPDGCTAPELAGTAMEGHAGTKWLTSSVAVAPGEDIEMVFTVFDVGDGVLDSAVLLDNVRWGCAEGDEPQTCVNDE